MKIMVEHHSQMLGVVSINGIPFSVRRAELENEHFRVSLSPAVEITDETNPLFSCVTAAIYCEGYALKEGKISGDLVLYTLEHEDFIESDLALRDGKLVGRGKATILGEPCTVEIVTPIDLTRH